MSAGDRSGQGESLDAARQHAARAETLLRIASAVSGAERAALLREGARALFAAGDERAARAAAREAFDAWPADDDAFREAVRDAAADVDRLNAVLAARAGAVAADAPACHRARADALLAFGRTEAALEAYRLCLTHSPDDREALAGIAEAHAELGEAEAALSSARRLVEASAGAEGRRAALELAARLASQFGDRAHAADLLESAAAVELRSEAPADAAHDLIERAVDALLRAGENARAGALLALAARSAQGAARARWLIRLAEAAASRGDLAAARIAREEALLADPSDAALRELHLADLERSGDHAGLVRAVEAALAAPGAEVASLSLRLGRARAAMGDEAGAERAFAAVCQLGPGTPGWDEAARALADHLDAKGDLEGRARLELARAGAATDAAARAAAFLTAASLLERAGELEEARSAAERARDADPGAVLPWRILARLELSAGDRAGSARALLGAAARCSGVAAASAALDAARLLDSAGLHDEALAAAQRAANEVPGSPAARRALAAKARAIGDVAGAARHLSLVDRDALASDERLAHDRALARALSEARDPGAEAAWGALFDRDESDGEAFDRVSEALRARGEAEQWLALAARHEGALSGTPDRARRCELRCERAALFTDLGDLDAAEGAWQAALAVDPRRRRALHGLRALIEQRGDHAGTADRIHAEAQVAEDPEEAAELFIDEARLSMERLHDRDRAARAIKLAVERLRSIPPQRARRLLAQAGRMGVGVEGLPALSSPAPAADARAPDEDAGDPVEDERLRSLAASSTGAERASYLHRLGVRLEQRGDREGAREVALEAFDADPSSAESFHRVVALVSDDRGRLVAAHRKRVRSARTPTARAAALIDLGGMLATAPASLPQAAQVLELAYALQPSSGAAAAALARVLVALGDPRRAVALLSRFEGGAGDLAPSEATRLLVEAAQAAGDPVLALEMARRAADRSPRDTGVLSTLSCALGAAGQEREAIAVEERALALEPPGPERLQRQAALAVRAEAAGDLVRALWLYEGIRAVRPDDISAMAAVARMYAAANDTFQLAAVARDLDRAGAGHVLGSLAADAGRALLRGGDAAAALRYLRQAYRLAPRDIAVLSDLAAAAERTGNFAEAVHAGAAAAGAEASRDPAAASSRLEHLAAIATESLQDVTLASDLRARAAAISPSKAASAAYAPPAAPREPAPRSIDDALARARSSLFDPAVAGQVANLARLLASGTPGLQLGRLMVLARSAADLAAFATATAPRRPGSVRPMRVLPDVRGSVAHPLAQGAPARLLATLAPFLEPLFPAELARRGVSGENRLGPRCAPELLALTEETQRALGTRACVAFLSEADGLDIAAENTTPPSLVLSAGLAGPMPSAERRFLLARALALFDLGWALLGKFAPHDIAMLCELACRFGDVSPPSSLLPEHRARPFLEALARSIPAAIRERAAALAAEAVSELPGLDAGQLTTALRQTAARIALLHTGDAYAALNALLASEKRLAGVLRTQVVEDGDVRDLGAFALSNDFLDRRGEAEGSS